MAVRLRGPLAGRQLAPPGVRPERRRPEPRLYAYARHPEHGLWGFPLGREPAAADRISFRWDLPNGSWGVFIDDECWAVCAHRPAQRMNRHRLLSRSGPHPRPFTAEEIQFACAKRRGQKPGTRGFVVEE